MPDVIRLTRYCEGELPFRRTLVRMPGETDAQFYGRAQSTHLAWTTVTPGARIHFEVVIASVPADPLAEDDVWASKAMAQVVLDEPGTPATVRVAAAKLLNRLNGIVPSEVW